MVTQYSHYSALDIFPLKTEQWNIKNALNLGILHAIIEEYYRQ